MLSAKLKNAAFLILSIEFIPPLPHISHDTLDGVDVGERKSYIANIILNFILLNLIFELYSFDLKLLRNLFF